MLLLMIATELTQTQGQSYGPSIPVDTFHGRYVLEDTVSYFLSCYEYLLRFNTSNKVVNG